MGTTAQTALWFLPAVVPICLWVAWSDLATMKIPNKANLALLAAFVVLGFFALPFEDYLWRFAHVGVALVLGIVMNAMRMLGAGDAKFIAAAAPFVALSDLSGVALILGGCMILGFILHRVAGQTAIRNLVPDWQSWQEKSRFPMGFPLGAALILYLVLAAFRG